MFTVGEGSEGSTRKKFCMRYCNLPYSIRIALIPRLIVLLFRSLHADVVTLISFVVFTYSQSVCTTVIATNRLGSSTESVHCSIIVMINR